MLGLELFLDSFETADVVAEVVLPNCEIYGVGIVVRDIVVFSVVLGHIIGEGGAGVHVAGGLQNLLIEYGIYRSERLGH